MKQYEYKIIKNAVQNNLNKLGLEGWELVSVDGGWAYFKRELS